METLLFWDDNWLLRRDGLKRRIGRPVWEASYDDPLAIICMGAPSVWQDRANDRYLLFYTGFLPGATTADRPTALLASSKDGLCWQPETTQGLTELGRRKFSHQLMPRIRALRPPKGLKRSRCGWKTACAVMKSGLHRTAFAGSLCPEHAGIAWARSPAQACSIIQSATALCLRCAQTGVKDALP